MRFTPLLFIATLPLGMLLNASQASAQDDLFAGCQDIAVPVPAFSCSDGYLVPKQLVGTKCEHPEDLYNRCVVDSRLGVLSRGDQNGVDIVFSCRTDPNKTSEEIQSGVADQSKIEFYDIAAIQYERSTGKTCFYQYIGSQKSDEVMPAPLTPEGRDFWGRFGNNSERGTGYHICSGCHTNNAFIRTPHYDLRLMDVYAVAPDYVQTRRIKTAKGEHQVTLKATDKLLPDIYGSQKYVPLNTNRDISWVAEDGNSCNVCHSIGFYFDVRENRYKLGKMNDLVSGRFHSIGDGRNAPSFNTFDDFMVEQVRQYLENDCIAGAQAHEAGACEAWRRSYAIDEVEELHKCVNNPNGEGCRGANPASGNVPHESVAQKSVEWAGRPDDPSSMAGLRIMKRYGSQDKGVCLSAVGSDIRNGTPVQQVPCNKTYENSQNWLYDADRGLMRSAQHQQMCLTVRPLYINSDASRESWDHFSGATVRYAYYSQTVLWDCNSRGPENHFLNQWAWNGVQVIQSRQLPEFCLSGQDDYVWTREEITKAYAEPCTRNANGSFWILTTEQTVGAAIAASQ